MPISYTFRSGVALSFGAALVSIGCSTVEVDTSKTVNTARVMVTGAADKLLKFDTKLRSLVGVGNDDTDALGCDNCGDLRSGDSSIGTLTYYIPRKPEKALRLFGAAWNEVWYDPGPPLFDAADGKRLILTIDANMSVQPVCSTGFLAPCYSRPNCPNTGFCSQNPVPPGGSCLPKCAKAP
jgi:hypothetical protein